MSQGPGVCKVVYGSDFQVWVLINNHLEGVAAYSSEAVDGNFYHKSSNIESVSNLRIRIFGLIRYSLMLRSFNIFSLSNPTTICPSISTTGTPIWPDFCTNSSTNFSS